MLQEKVVEALQLSWRGIDTSELLLLLLLRPVWILAQVQPAVGTTFIAWHATYG